VDSGDHPRTLDPREGLGHAWQWFSLHAGQRMQCVNFYLLATGFLVAGFGTAVTAKQFAIAGTIAALGAWLTVLFHALEIRTRELVKAGEAALRKAERSLAEATEVREFMIVESVEKPKIGWSSYSCVIRALHATTFVVFLIGAIFAFKHP